MKYRIFKLEFLGPVHIGETSLADHGVSIGADTLFSALAAEALKSGGVESLERLRDSVRSGGLIFSDAFPYIGGEYFVKKPIFRRTDDQSAGDAEEDSRNKKKFKKLKYMPLAAIDAYFAGDFEPDDTLRGFSEHLGVAAVQTKAAVRTGNQTLPYRVGVFGFKKGAGLYLIAGGAEESLAFFEELMDGLSKSGVGGKRSAGMGRFAVCADGFDGTTADRLEVPSKQGAEAAFSRYMTLSLSLPRDDELDSAIEGSSFSLLKRSGFVYSENYSNESLRKNDLYVFDAGSVFAKKFSGDVYDVSNHGAHPVYRYAKPLFLGVNI
jgi:CRISPR-associated protein Csm4